MKEKVPNRIPEIAYKKILHTTDLSESGRFAFHHAASLARRYGAELTVFHVIEGGMELDSRLFGYVDEKLWDEIKTRNLEEVRSILINRKRDNAAIKECVSQFHEDLQEFIGDENADITYRIEVRMGRPVDQILKEAEENHYDLIVMASHGHGLIKATLMGDTVLHVAKHSKVPVLIVRVQRD